jgi:hypothetical protein
MRWLLSIPPWFDSGSDPTAAWLRVVPLLLCIIVHKLACIIDKLVFEQPPFLF